MPQYAYRCPNAHTTEIAHSITEDPDVTCPDCGERMARLPQTTTIKFLGKGWASKE